MILSNTQSAILIGVLGGWIYGYSLGITSGITVPMINTIYFPHSTDGIQSLWQGLLSTSVIIGGLLGSFWPVHSRKLTIVHMSLLVTVFSTLQVIWTQSCVMLVINRIVVGLGVGCTGVVIPMLINELMCGSSIAGQVGVVFQISICTSILLAQLLNYVFNPNNDISIENYVWQVQLSLGSVPAAVLGLSCYFDLVNESPIYMSQQHTDSDNDDDTSINTQPLAHNMNIDSESSTPTNNNEYNKAVQIHHIDMTQSLTQNINTTAQPKPVGWDLLFSRYGLKYIGIACTLAFSSQLTGINIFILYAPKIFADAHMSINPLLMTLLFVGVWNLCSVFVSFLLIEKLGRKILLLSALTLMTTSCIIMSLSSNVLIEYKTPLSILSIVLFVLAFESGPGPLFFVVASESFPIKLKTVGISLANALAWISNIILILIFPTLINLIGSTWVFMILACIAGSCIIAVQLLIHDKQKSHMLLTDTTSTNQSTSQQDKIQPI